MSTTDVYASGYDGASGKTIEADDCPECPGRIVTDGGERRCSECGLIVDAYRFDHGPGHYRFGETGEDRRRTGVPLTPARHDRGLSTEIGRGVDGKGAPLSLSARRQYGRLRREHSRAKWRSKRERNLGYALSEIARIVSALELPRSVREAASVVYRRAQAENLIMGRSIEAIASGSVYAACRCGGYTRTIEEIAAVSCCSGSTVRLGYQVVNVELELATAPVTPLDLVPRLASACGASSAVERRALELASVAEEAGLANGRKPSGVAAGCLYVAGLESERRITQTELAEAASVSDVTVRERYNELQALLGDNAAGGDELPSQ